MRIEARPFDDPEAAALRAELEADVVVRYGYDNEPGAKPSAGDVAVFLVAVDEEPLGAAACGCWATARPRSSACGSAPRPRTGVGARCWPRSRTRRARAA